MYVTFMKYNETIESFVKRTFARITKRNKVDLQPANNGNNTDSNAAIAHISSASTAIGHRNGTAGGGMDSGVPGTSASGRRFVSLFSNIFFSCSSIYLLSPFFILPETSFGWNKNGENFSQTNS